ncbi:MAG: MOSC domain-containing protein, partial [Acidobacteriaceae bacterium]|nr:MOSC domain-containing protein [Acidobacteriaceae bacterium]
LWRDELGRSDFGPGVLGENLEVTGQSEATVCIGDTYRAGEVVVQVSQPRQPCWKPARLHGYPELTRLMAKQSRTGWYLRVLHPGILEAPCAIELIRRPHPTWTIERANRLLYHKAESREAKLELANLPELSTAWQEMLSTPA